MNLKKLIGIAVLLCASATGWGATFVDDLGVQRKLPDQITKVAPSGKLAQIMLATFDHQKVMGLAGKASEREIKLWPEFAQLPVFGQFYGKNVSLNMEALIKAAPQVIVDLGEEKKTIKEDMQGVMDQTGLPTVFIRADMDSLDHAYQRLGELLSMPERGKQLADYIHRAYEEVAARKAAVANKKIKVYFALGEDGLSTNAKGSFHAVALDMVGLENAVDLDPNTKGAGTKVNFENILKWDPDVIICESEDVRKILTTDPAWSALRAVADGKVYLVPSSPYNWVFNPPSVNRILGLYWLGKKLTPEIYDFDVNSRIKEFYDLFYGQKLDDQQIEEFMAQ